MFTAQEILVGNADYPTEKIAENEPPFRQLGLGYANLGALLMAQGLPYDSDGGRAWAGAHHRADDRPRLRHERPHGRAAWVRSPGYADNADADAERAAHAPRRGGEDRRRRWSRPSCSPPRSSRGTRRVELGESYGVRNSQATVLAPTGTIGLMMDCDTTGIEPDLALTKAKKLVGGGTMLIVNQTDARVRCAGSGTRASRSTQIVAHIDEHKSIVGAPGFNPEHLPVFACSMGDNTIHYMGHVTMMGAVQPFISGAICKTVQHARGGDGRRASSSCTSRPWQLGLKAVAIYRDNCKVAQPLATQKKAGDDTLRRSRSSGSSST